MQIAFRTVGGVLDLSFFLGPSLSDVIAQYTEVCQVIQRLYLCKMIAYGWIR